MIRSPYELERHHFPPEGIFQSADSCRILRHQCNPTFVVYSSVDGCCFICQSIEPPDTESSVITFSVLRTNTQINIRAKSIRSLDNIFIIVPNTEFVEERVTNWSYGDLKIKINVNVDVSYNSDSKKVLSALREVAEENNNGLKEPKPEVLLMEFGESSRNMQLRVWIADPKDYYRILSAINCAIVNKFREQHIEIPFPQRDVHVRSSVSIPLDKN